MKKGWFLFVILLIANGVTAQNEVIKKALTERFAALQKLDKKAIASFHAPKSTVVVSGEAFADINAYLTKQLPEFEGTGVVFDNHVVDVTKAETNWATATESYQYSFKKGEKAIKGTGTATYTFQKTGSKWRIVQFHVSFKRQ